MDNTSYYHSCCSALIKIVFIDAIHSVLCHSRLEVELWILYAWGRGWVHHLSFLGSHTNFCSSCGFFSCCSFTYHLHISTNNEKLGRILPERKSAVASDETQAMNWTSTSGVQLFSSAVLETRRTSSWNSAFLGSRKPYPDVHSPDFASESKELQSFLPSCVCIPLIIPSTYPLHWVPDQSSRLWVRASLRRSPRRTCWRSRRRRQSPCLRASVHLAGYHVPGSRVPNRRYRSELQPDPRECWYTPSENKYERNA